MPGEPKTIGRYEVQRELGHGAMGVVYLAFDPLLKRPLAIKTVREFGADAESTLVRFQREAEISARLNHPNIVTIHDVGQDPEAGPFLAMEFIDGLPLSDLIREGIPLEGVINLLLQGMSALQAAERAGIIHRDIKPANILVSHDGRLKLMDFGIARGEGTRLTQTGQIIGTPSYTAPEALGGAEPSAVTDRYAFAVTAFQMLTAELPFECATIAATLFRIVHDPPVFPDTMRPGERRVFERALAKDPADRFPDLGTFMRDLIWSVALPADAKARFLASLSRDTGAQVSHLMRSHPGETSSFNRNRETRATPSPARRSAERFRDRATAAFHTPRPGAAPLPLPAAALPPEQAGTQIVPLQPLPPAAPPAEATVVFPAAGSSTLAAAVPEPGPPAADAPFLPAPDPGGAGAPLPLEAEPASRATPVPPVPDPEPMPLEEGPWAYDAPLFPEVESASRVTPVPSGAAPFLPAPESAPPEEESGELPPEAEYASRATPVPPGGAAALEPGPPEEAPEAESLPAEPPAPPEEGAAGPSPEPPRAWPRWTAAALLGAAILAGGAVWALRPRSFLMDISSIPDGARVLLDGRELGRTDLAGVRIPGSGGTLRLELEGFEPQELPVRKGAGPVRVALVPAPFTVQVVTDPPGAEALLNGVSKGATPIRDLQVPASGPQELVLRLADRKEWAQVLDRARPLPAVIVLEPASTSLRISTSPPGAEAYINGARIGVTPLPKVAVKARGDQRLVLRLKNYKEWSGTLNPGRSLPDPIVLVPLVAHFSVRTEPAGGTVFLDGRKVGVSPLLDLAVPYQGSHTVVITREGCEDWSATLDPARPLPNPIVLAQARRTPALATGALAPAPKTAAEPAAPKPATVPVSTAPAPAATRSQDSGKH